MTITVIEMGAISIRVNSCSCQTKRSGCRQRRAQHPASPHHAVQEVKHWATRASRHFQEGPDATHNTCQFGFPEVLVLPLLSISGPSGADHDLEGTALGRQSNGCSALCDCADKFSITQALRIPRLSPVTIFAPVSRCESFCASTPNAATDSAVDRTLHAALPFHTDFQHGSHRYHQA